MTETRDVVTLIELLRRVVVESKLAAHNLECCERLLDEPATFRRSIGCPGCDARMTLDAYHRTKGGKK